MKVRDDDGTLLDATFTVEVSGASIDVCFESKGGTAGTPSARNTDYNLGLQRLLERLAVLGARVTDAVVDSQSTRHVQVADRRLQIDGYPFDIRLHEVRDFRALRIAMGRAQQQVGRKPGARGSGNPQKRVRITLAGLPTASPSVLEEMVGGPSAMPAAVARAAAEAVERAQARARGQGFSSDPEFNRTVELHAMAVAQEHGEAAGWGTAENTSADRPYDFVFRHPDGTKRFVEVKGTTGSGETVTVTFNEVEHAMSSEVHAILIIVSKIDVTRTDAGGLVAAGGQLVVVDPWRPADYGSLKPIAYRYSVPPHAPGTPPTGDHHG